MVEKIILLYKNVNYAVNYKNTMLEQTLLPSETAFITTGSSPTYNGSLQTPSIFIII